MKGARQSATCRAHPCVVDGTSLIVPTPAGCCGLVGARGLAGQLVWPLWRTTSPRDLGAAGCQRPQRCSRGGSAARGVPRSPPAGSRYVMRNRRRLLFASHPSLALTIGALSAAGCDSEGHPEPWVPGGRGGRSPRSVSEPFPAGRPADRCSCCARLASAQMPLAAAMYVAGLLLHLRASLPRHPRSPLPLSVRLTPPGHICAGYARNYLVPQKFATYATRSPPPRAPPRRHAPSPGPRQRRATPARA